MTPTDWQNEVFARIAASEYAVHSGAAFLEAVNRARGVRSSWTERGVEVHLQPSGDSASATSPTSPTSPSTPATAPTVESVRLLAVGIGRGDDTRVIDSPSWKLGACRADGAVDETGACLRRVEAQHESLTEWWENSPRGVEQGFDLARDPLPGDGRLSVRVRVEGATVTLDPSGAAATLTQSDGSTLRYDQLSAVDAAGRTLPVRLQQTEGGLAIELDDTRAEYPLHIDPVVSAWSANGASQSNSDFGASVSAAGDVNHDGYTDAIIGAPTYTAGGKHGAGAAFLYMGGATGLSATPAWRLDGTQANGVLGNSVAGVGDVDGDGYDDVAIGAPSFDSAGLTDNGRVYVVFGAKSPNTRRKVTLDGVGTRSYLGVSVAGAGDTNGDGLKDVLAAGQGDAFTTPPSSVGRVALYTGMPSGINTAPLWQVTPSGASMYGITVANAGDVNCDGRADAIVSDASANGSVYVYLGLASGYAAQPAFRRPGVSTETVRIATPLGDVNHDGCAEVGVSIYATSGGAGKLQIYAGDRTNILNFAQTLFQGTGIFIGVAAGDVDRDGYQDILTESTYGPLAIYRGNSLAGFDITPFWNVDSPSASYGVSTTAAADFNADGYPDILTGAPLYDGNATGMAYAYYGSPVGPTGGRLLQAKETQAGAKLGYSVSVGDINNDGFADTVVGAPYYDVNTVVDSGAVFVYFGPPGQTQIAPVRLYDPASYSGPTQANEHYGASVAVVGDMDGDGWAEIAVSAPDRDAGAGADTGCVYIYRGGPSGIQNVTYSGCSVQAGAHYGYSVAAAGDVNGDGLADVILGTPYRTITQTAEGSVTIMKGVLGGSPASFASFPATAQAYAHLGWSVAAAGDVDGDGFGDVIAGAPYFDLTGKIDEGRAYMYYGTATGLRTTAWTFDSQQAGAHAGFVVSGVGDTDNDGYADVMVGAPQYSATIGGSSYTNSGRAWVFKGGSQTSPWYYDMAISGGAFAQSVAAGDFNGDGLSDVAIGGFATTSGTAAPRVYAFLGSNTGLSLTAMALGFGYGASPTPSVALGAGDLNGDGIADLVHGAPGTASTDTSATYFVLGPMGR